MRKLRDTAQEEALAIASILNELSILMRAHPKKFGLFILLELWVHGLMFQHLAELKHIYELIPFLH